MDTDINVAPVTDQPDAGARQSRVRSFMDGFGLGLGSAALLLAGELPRPRAPTSGLASDWRAIGRDIYTALSAYGR
jgi:hypothetical protein